MSANPPIPEHLRPLAPGYTPRQTQLDAEMVALGRPHATASTLLDPVGRAGHRADVEAWERDNPLAAVRWVELRAQQRTEDARLYAERYGPEAYAFEQMRLAGFSERALEHVRRELRDTACFTATRDWLLDGTTWSLVLTGPPGCGKTLAATWAAHQMLTRNFSPRCVQCLKRSESPLFGVAAEEERWRCREAGVLVLDDLGEGEQRNEKRAHWRGWVDDVLTERHAHHRKTVITTNRTTAELRDWLGARLVDRLNEGLTVSTNEPSMRGREPGSEG